jgi:hypothetical protein
MMYDFKLFIARLGDDGAPEAYAIVQGTGVNLEPIDKLFGAAWYLDTGTFDGIFFAGNGAEGLFTVATPIRRIDDDGCWNSGSDYAAHVACDAAVAVVVLYSTSTETPDNDGLNCPTDAADSVIDAFDCTKEGTQPFQLLKATGDAYYSLKRLDNGVYVNIYNLSYTDANDINAAAIGPGRRPTPHVLEERRHQNWMNYSPNNQKTTNGRSPWGVQAARSSMKKTATTKFTL